MLVGRICKSEFNWQGARVRVTQIKQIGPSTFIEAMDIATGQKYPLQMVNESKIIPVDNERDCRNYFHWWIEAHRIGALNLRNEHISRTIANIKPEMYQIQAVYGYLLHPGPIRHLLADDPGTGKTIMAIMLMLEMAARQPGMRIVLSVPPGLISKWQKELVQKFGILDFRVVDGRDFQLEHHNPWLAYDRILISSYTGRMPKQMTKLLQENVKFDLSIVDEAHRLASPESGWNFPYLKALSEKSRNLLFMTATPHAGKHQQFTEFINLLVPGLVLDAYGEQDRENVSTLMIRRMKEDLKTPTGDPLFKPRHVQTLKIEMTDQERDIYQLLNEYLQQTYALHQGEKRAPIQLIRPIYQRRHASSLAALKLSLERRMTFLQGVTFETVGKTEIPEDELLEDEYTQDDLTALETAVVDEEARQNEIRCVDQLVKMIDRAGLENSGKSLFLKKFLEENFNSPGNADEQKSKLLIFTEHRETALWLVENLRREGWKVVAIHGGLKMLPEMPTEIAPFQNDREAPDRLTAQYWFEHDATICVATDAAGEGIDLQFCHLMINYDMPWNPTRLEQRMGRIHRYGQIEAVTITNFLVEGTIEDDIQIVIQEKLRIISEDYARLHERGAELVYDVISTVLNDGELQQVIARLHELPEEERDAEKARFADDFAKRQKEAVEQAKQLCQSARLRPVVVGDEVPAPGSQDDFRTTPEYSENFFRAAWILLGGQMERDSTPPAPSIGYSTWVISWSGDWPEWVKKYCSQCLEQSKISVNFDFVKKNVLLLHPGVPLFDAVVEMVGRQLESIRRFDVAVDPKTTSPYCLYFFKYEYVNGLSQTVGKFVEAIRQVFPQLNGNGSDHGSQFEDCTDARVHFNLHMVPLDTYEKIVPFLSSWLNEGEAEAWLISRLPQYLEDWKKDYQEQDRTQLKMLKEKADFVWKKRGGERDPGARARLNTAWEQIDHSLKQKEQELRVTYSWPEYLGSLLVLPAKRTDPSQERIEPVDNYLDLLQNVNIGSESGYLTQGEIERIAMDEVAKHEEKHGRKIKDRSRITRIGYDLLSVGPNEIREIEVKGHAGHGDIILEENELAHLQQHSQRAWVYVVEDCGTDYPKVHPLSKLLATSVPFGFQDTRIRYRISREQWYNAFQQGEK